jgi:hypothetical protein
MAGRCGSIATAIFLYHIKQRKLVLLQGPVHDDFHTRELEIMPMQQLTIRVTLYLCVACLYEMGTRWTA